MSYLSFNEKSWDKVRPFAVKKTGVSEAIRAFEKVVPNKLEDLATEAGCTDAAELLDTLSTKLTGAKQRLDAKKHEKEIKQVSAWIGEVAVRKKAISSYAAKLHKENEDAIAEANKAIDPYFDQVEELMAAARDLLSNLQDKAKEATVAGVKAEMDKLLKCKEHAEKAKPGFDHILSEARAIPQKAVKAADAKLPKGAALTDGQKRKRELTVDRCTAIKYKVQDLDDLVPVFREAFELITFAETKGDNLQEKFAKMVEADAAMCRKLAAELGTSETSVDMDLQKVAEILDEAGKPQVEKQQKAILLGEAAKWLKGGAGRVKRFHGQIENLTKTLQAKTGNYPDFVTAKDEKFKKPLEQLGVVEKFAVDMNTKSYPAFVKKAKSYGEKILELQKM